jgi:hypothetical protein
LLVHNLHTTKKEKKKKRGKKVFVGWKVRPKSWSAGNFSKSGKRTFENLKNGLFLSTSPNISAGRACPNPKNGVDTCNTKESILSSR